MAQKRVSHPKTVYCKNYISGSEGNLKFPYLRWFGFKTQENHSSHFNP